VIPKAKVVPGQWGIIFNSVSIRGTLRVELYLIPLTFLRVQRLFLGRNWNTVDSGLLMSGHSGITPFTARPSQGLRISETSPECYRITPGINTFSTFLTLRNQHFLKPPPWAVLEWETVYVVGSSRSARNQPESTECYSFSAGEGPQGLRSPLIT